MPCFAAVCARYAVFAYSVQNARRMIEISARVCYNGGMGLFGESMPPEKARALGAVALAFVGDAAESLFVREGLVRAADRRPGELQKLAGAEVSAKGQAKRLAAAEKLFTEEEREIFLRGRNAKKATKSKHATVAEYNLSTGFEAVLGYLYLTGQYARIAELLTAEEI